MLLIPNCEGKLSPETRVDGEFCCGLDSLGLPLVDGALLRTKYQIISRIIHGGSSVMPKIPGWAAFVQLTIMMSADEYGKPERFGNKYVHSVA